MISFKFKLTDLSREDKWTGYTGSEWITLKKSYFFEFIFISSSTSPPLLINHY